METPRPSSPTAHAALAALKQELKDAINDWCREKNESRAQFCDRVAAAAGRPLDVSKLYHWLEQDERRVPGARYLAAICCVLGRPAPIAALLAPAGFVAVSADVARFIPAARALAACVGSFTQQESAA